MPWLESSFSGLGVKIEFFCVAVDMPASDASDSVVEKEALGFKSTSDVSNVILRDGWAIVRRLADLGIVLTD